MKAWIVYDTLWGNTERIARSVGEAVGGGVRVSRVGEVDPSEAETVDLLIVGSPTQGGAPTQAIQGFLNAIPPGALGRVRVAAFDTRIPMKFAKIFGYAAEKISASLVRKGGSEATAPAGFFVGGRKGPLSAGELERAAGWGRECRAS